MSNDIGKELLIISQTDVYSSCEVSGYCVIGGWGALDSRLGRIFVLAVDILQILEWCSALRAIDHDT